MGIGFLLERSALMLAGMRNVTSRIGLHSEKINKHDFKILPASVENKSVKVFLDAKK